jgi:hypothetical protein
MKQKNLRDADIIEDLSIATLKIPLKNKLKTEGPCYGPAHGRQLTGTPDRNP